MKKHFFVIKGRLPDLNDYLKAERTFSKKHSCGNDMKQECQLLICNSIRLQLKRTVIKNPVYVHFMFYEMNKRRDPDNITGVAKKFILDSLQKCQVIANDGWGNIKGFKDDFAIDKHNPRIEITLTEVGAGEAD